MECPRAYVTLVVLTVLELCRAGHIPPRWESTKLNDEFDQRSNPNSEPNYVPLPSIPSTRTSYPTSKQSFSTYSSTVPTHSSTGYSSTLPPSSTPVPTLYKQPQQRHVKIETVHSNIPYPFVQTFTPSDQQPLDLEPLRLISEIPHRNSLHNQHIEPPYPASLPVQNLFQPQPQTTERLQPIVVTSPADLTDDGYVVVYQPVSETDGDFPRTPYSKVAIRETGPGTFSTVPVAELSTTRPTSFSTSIPTTLLSSTTPFIASTTPAPASPTKRFTVPVSTSTVTLKPKTIVTNSTANSFRIKVLAPSGTITNVHINGVKQTTTKKPKTKRTSKPKKNTYERCLNRCKKVKDQICGAPLGHYSVSAKDLKTFESVCHMACYNSFKKDAFEKLESGHCDKLRRKLGKSNVIVREQLKKAYAIAAKQSDTIIQLSKDILKEK